MEKLTTRRPCKTILAKKVSRKVLDEPGLEDLKIRFHHLVIAFQLHERDAFEMAQSHLVCVPVVRVEK